jgi:hypothetical protein
MTQRVLACGIKGFHRDTLRMHKEHRDSFKIDEVSQ